ncbi:polymorphic toxin-type HINT domain-containing protein [Promicromonospora vindobonensis]|uniref:Polymorphic toxin-type HINT domain-containing protein n=1 Tax=Promicromonospora vindobonensis TaxID=195748 RepID=A0ABW5VQX7_9MICO
MFYDKLYRPLRTAAVIPPAEGELAGTYMTNTTYTPAGNVKGMGWGATGGLPGQSVSYIYDDATGWLESTSGPNGLGSELTYDNVGRVLQTEMAANLGKPLWATNTYDSATGRLATYRVDRLDQPGVDRHETYEYDEAGNILSLADVSRTGTDVQCFDYDYLARVVDAWTQKTTGAACAATGQDAADAALIGGPARYWHEYDYDKVGSRTREVLHSGGGQRLTDRTYSYDAGQPHTVTSVNQVQPATSTLPRVESVEQYSYDAVGRATSRQIGGDTQTLSWTPESRVQHVEDADGTGAEYVYDADGNRLISRTTTAEGTESTLYLGHTEITVTSAEPTVAKATRYFDVGGGHMAVEDDSARHTFVLTDHHGTGQLSVSAADLTIEQRRSTPFGGDRGAVPTDWAGSRGFVGGYDDRVTTGLVSLGAREYDPALGRFISLDPIMDLSDPQQIHGYSYASNSPVSVSDPTGLIEWDDAPPGSAPREEALERAKQGGSCYQNCDLAGSTRGPGVPIGRGSGGNAGGSAVDGAGTAGTATSGPTADEIARAQAVMDKSITDVALELGWEALKEFVGWNDLMGCLNKDLAGCGMLAAGIVPIGKGLKAVKAIYKVIEGVIDLTKRIKWARGVISRSTRGGPSGGPTACNSFAPGTLVLLADGSRKPIEDVELGDEVLAADEDTGEVTEGREVTALITGEGDKALVTVTVRVADGGVQELVTTNEHPFWAPNREVWVEAIDLAVGDWLQTSAGTWVQVAAIDIERQQTVVHNLTIAADHTYHVAGRNDADPLLVHNSGADPTGYVYLRTDQATGQEYVGQSRDSATFERRQRDHAKKFPNAQFEFDVLGRAVPGADLDRLEEDWIRAGGGSVRDPDSILANKRHQMNPDRYLAAGGTCPLN